MEKKTHWGNVADWYDDLIGQDGSDFHKEIIFPGVLKMLNIFKKEVADDYQLLDLACGQGVFCRLLSNLNISTTGIDYSSELVNIAKTRGFEKKQPQYLVHDITKLIDENDDLISELKSNSFDSVTIILAIQNIKVLTPVFRAVNKLLKPNGSLVMVLMHPCFRIPQHSDWQWNKEKEIQERVLSKYLISEEIFITTNPGKQSSGDYSETTTHFHRPLQAYINTLGNSGLAIDHIEEWVTNKKEQVGKKSVAIEKAKKEFPLFLAIRAKKYN